MSEDRAADGDRVAGSQDYEVGYFAQKHGITEEQAQMLILQHGNMRERLDEEAEKLRK